MKIQSPFELSFLTLAEMSPKWCLQQACEMIDFHPISEAANASGKFFNVYKCWHFHKSSQWPLIQKFNDLLSDQKTFFEQMMGKKLNYEFLVLSVVDEYDSPVCNLHRDGYFFDGQLHLTIQGNANIDVHTDPGKVQHLSFPNGQLWYLNGSRFAHKISPVKSRRIELCAPLNQRADDVGVKMKAVTNDRYRWVDGSNQEWLNLRAKQSAYVVNAVKKGTASNLKIADFSVRPERQ